LRHPFRMLGYLTPLKQWNLHRRFNQDAYFTTNLILNDYIEKRYLNLKNLTK